MKHLFRNFVIDTYSLWLITQLASGIQLEKGFKSLIMAGLALAVVSLFAKPVINILLLPLNLVTFGLFRWVSSAIVLYLATLLIPTFKITGFFFTGYDSKWIYIPEVNIHGFLAYVFFAFLLSIITSFIYWLIK